MYKDRLLLSALRAVASAVTRRDRYTSGHSERVAEYCERVAGALQLSEDHCYFLSLSVLPFKLAFQVGLPLSCETVLSGNGPPSVAGRIHPISSCGGNDLHPTRPFFYFFAGPSRWCVDP